jgi:DNA-directed RNA polymerase subunit RPC12/RpoP
MERSISSLRYESGSPVLSATHESSRCSTCGEEFKAPLLAMVSSGVLIEEYYACPKCLSKVGSYERKKVEVEETDDEEEESREMEVEEKVEETVVCPHHLGYLKRRSKNTPVPEECLTCSKMIDCMSG